MESSAVSSYYNEMIIALNLRMYTLTKCFTKKSFWDLFGSLFWMRYENKVGFFFYVLEILYSIEK